MELSAANDWETTCTIYEDRLTSSTLDNSGNLLRASIEIPVNMVGTVYCRRRSPLQYRFWTLPDANLLFRVEFWCHPDPPNDYARVNICLLSSYPHSFPRESKQQWMEWMNVKALSIVREEQLSYSVCDFVEHQAFEFFPILWNNGDQKLILLEDDGPTFYNQTTLVSESVKKIVPLCRHHPNGSHETLHDSSALSKDETAYILPILKIWRRWLPIRCPICLESVPPGEATTITCGHDFCRHCISMYCQFKAQELNSENRNNPFLCPLPKCRKHMLIVGCVKQFLEESLMDKVRAWYKDVKNPICWSLPVCLKKTCESTLLRREAIDSYIVFCETCHGRWCELCLRRASQHKEHDQASCQVRLDANVQFCERYLAANDKAKRRCEERWPWIPIYAKSRIHDQTFVRWIRSNGQVCPGCKLGIERVEGCFHMSCQCGTHFCYECGEELHPPFYGTHHCWETNNTMFGNQ